MIARALDLHNDNAASAAAWIVSLNKINKAFTTLYDAFPTASEPTIRKALSSTHGDFMAAFLSLSRSYPCAWDKDKVVPNRASGSLGGARQSKGVLSVDDDSVEEFLLRDSTYIKFE